MLDFTAGSTSGPLDPWLDEMRNRITAIDPDAAGMIFDQSIYAMPIVPPEPKPPVVSSTGSSSERAQMRHDLAMHTAMISIRALSTKKVSHLASGFKILQEGLTDKFKTRLSARDSVADAIKASNPMVYLREIIAVAKGLGEGSHIIQFASAVDALHGFMHGETGKNSLASEETLGSLMDRAQAIFTSLKENPAHTAQLKVYLYIKNLRPSYPKTKESLLPHALSASTLHLLPASIPLARERADLLDCKPPAPPEPPKSSGSARGRAPTGGHVEDEDDGTGGSSADPGRAPCTKCPAGSSRSKSHSTNDHYDGPRRPREPAGDDAALPAGKERRREGSRGRDRRDRSSRDGAKPGKDKDSGGKDSIIDLQGGDSRKKQKKGSMYSVRLQKTIHPTDMPSDTSRPKCFSLQDSSAVIQTLDCGTMIPATNDLSALVDVRDVDTPVTTLGGNIVFRKIGKHREFGCETVYDSSVDISLFNFSHVEEEYSLTQLHMKTVGVDGSTGFEKKVVTGFSFTRDGDPDPDGPSVLRRLTFMREASGVNKHLFVRDRNADVYTPGPAKKSGSVRARHDDDDDDDDDDDGRSTYSLSSGSYDSEDSDSDDASISSDGYSSGAASDSDGGGDSN
jgi:hypothetical protein